VNGLHSQALRSSSRLGHGAEHTGSDLGCPAVHSPAAVREILTLFNFHVKGPVLRELLLASFLEDLDRRVRITLGERGLLSLGESGSLAQSTALIIACCTRPHLPPVTAGVSPGVWGPCPLSEPALLSLARQHGTLHTCTSAGTCRCRTVTRTSPSHNSDSRVQSVPRDSRLPLQAPLAPLGTGPSGSRRQPGRHATSAALTLAWSSQWRHPSQSDSVGIIMTR
jgi:hypothetical protein